MQWWLIVIIILVVMIMGYLITSQGVKDWLFDGSKTTLSPHQPPRVVFGIVWTILYIIYGLVWYFSSRGDNSVWIDIIFTVGIVLNLLWVYVFFGTRDLLASKIIIVMMIVLGLYQAYLVWNNSSSAISGVLTFGILIYVSWLVVATGLTFGTTFL